MAFKPGVQNNPAQEKKRPPASDASGKAAATESVTVAAGGKSTVNPIHSPLMDKAYDRSYLMPTRRMTMPVTKKEVELITFKLDPDTIWVSDRINPRNQSLLSEHDPKIIALRNNIRDESQREPVLVRRNPGPEGEPYELIYGSRRRFVGTLEKRIHGSFDLLAEVGEINDADAMRLAREENEQREDLSAWEKAQFLARLSQSLYKDHSDAEMAAAEGMAKNTLSKYLAIARIPLEVVALLESPSLLALNSGNTLLKAVDTLGEKKAIQIASQMAKTQARYDKVTKVVELLNTEMPPSVESFKVSAKKAIEYGSKDGAVKARIKAIRGKENAFKIDIEGVGKDGLARIDALLSDLCKG